MEICKSSTIISEAIGPVPAAGAHTGNAVCLEMHKLTFHSTRIFIAITLAAFVVVFGLLARPNPPSLSTDVTGDPALAAWMRPMLQGALDRVSIARIDGSSVTYAGFGADEH